MITTPWDAIAAATLQALCDAGGPESPTLDFKRVAPLKQGDDPRNEFAKDACAFANVNGGDLVYGVGTREDCADQLTPLARESPDACQRRLSDVLANDVPPAVCDRLSNAVALIRPIVLSPCIAPNTRQVSVQRMNGSTIVMIYGTINNYVGTLLSGSFPRLSRPVQ